MKGFQLRLDVRNHGLQIFNSGYAIFRIFPHFCSKLEACERKSSEQMAAAERARAELKDVEQELQDSSRSIAMVRFWPPAISLELGFL